MRSPDRYISDHQHGFMTIPEQEAISEEYRAFLHNKAFPCIGARAALAQGNITCMVAMHMACPAHDRLILRFLYDFIDNYRSSDTLFHSAAILFEGPVMHSDEMFDSLMWEQLGAVNTDAENFGYDQRVDADPASPKFSFSLKEEAFFIIGLHPASSREARRFSRPVLAFNPHAQFEKLRETERYERMKEVIRRRDVSFSGSVNPMLDDFGQTLRIYQYSGRNYAKDWQCPLNIPHGKANHHSSLADASFTLKKGQQLTVVGLEGEQVSDLICFNLDDKAEYLSSGRTIDYAETIFLTKGFPFYSNRSNVMFDMVEDTVGRHDFLLTPCSA